MPFIEDSENAVVYIDGHKIIPTEIEAHLERDTRHVHSEPPLKVKGTTVVTSQEYDLIIYTEDSLDVKMEDPMVNVEVKDANGIIVLEDALLRGYTSGEHEDIIEITATKVERREGTPDFEALNVDGIEYRLRD